jgi:hypothetical protein
MRALLLIALLALPALTAGQEPATLDSPAVVDEMNIAHLTARVEDLEARNARLEARTAQLEAKVVRLERSHKRKAKRK